MNSYLCITTGSYNRRTSMCTSKEWIKDLIASMQEYSFKCKNIQLNILHIFKSNVCRIPLLWRHSRGSEAKWREVKVLSVCMSTFGLRVQIALELKGIPYEYCVEDLDNKSQLLLESNPVHKMVPVLIHNGKPVCESLNIMEYIDETWKNQGPHLLPEDPYERSVARFWADLISRKVFDAVKIIWRTEGEKQKKGIEDLINLYVLLDDALGKISKGKPFFGGDEIGFLDVAFGPFVSWFHAWEIFGEFKFPGEDKCPRIPKFFQAFSSHPKVKKLLGDQRRY